jgi:hypothetical protein
MIYVTDNENIYEYLESILDTDIETILLLKFRYKFELNTNSRYILNINNYKICLNYLSYDDVTKLKPCQNEFFANACEPNVEGQTNYEILMKMAGIETKKHKRVWLNDMTSRKFTLEENDVYKSLIYPHLYELFLELFWISEIEGRKHMFSQVELYMLYKINEKMKIVAEKAGEINKSKIKLSIQCSEINFLLYDNTSEVRISTDDFINYKETLEKNSLFITTSSLKTRIKKHPRLLNTVDVFNYINKTKATDSNDINNALNNLYNNGYITNPQTISRVLPVGMQGEIVSILKTLKANDTYKETITEFADNQGSTFILSSRIFGKEKADSDHAILVTGKKFIEAEHNKLENKIYNFIATRILEAVFGDAKIKTFKIRGLINDKFSVRYDSETIEEPGHLKLNNINKSSNDELLRLDNLKNYYREGTTHEITGIKPILVRRVHIGNYTKHQLIRIIENYGKFYKSERKIDYISKLKMSRRKSLSNFLEKLENNGFIVTNVDGRITLDIEGIKAVTDYENTVFNVVEIEDGIKNSKRIHDISTLRKVLINELKKLETHAKAKNVEEKLQKIDYSDIRKKLCPRCFGELIFNNLEYVKCKKCRLKIKKIISNYILTEIDYKQLIDHGTTDIKTFTGKKGEFQGRIALNNKGYCTIEFENS